MWQLRNRLLLHVKGLKRAEAPRRGLQRAQTARDDGEEWGAELIDQWKRALERYAKVYRIGRA